MSLRSRVVAVKGVRAGEIVGYGARWTVPKPGRIAVVPAGYADGLDRRMAGSCSVLIRGKRAPIVGAVNMDMITVDVSDVTVDTGDEVVIIGAQGDDRIDAREIAAAIGTNPYEVLCRVGTRIERILAAGVLCQHPAFRRTHPSRRRSVSRRHAVRSPRRARFARPAACRARSCTRRGRWRAACGGCSAAGACSTWAAATGCSRRSCCCSTIPHRVRSSSTKRCRLRARSFTTCSCRRGRGSTGRVAFVAADLDDVEILPRRCRRVKPCVRGA